MRRNLLTLAGILVLLACTHQSYAQTLFTLGPYVGYDTEFEDALAGAQLRLGGGLFPLIFQPGVEFDLNGFDYVRGEANALFPIGGPFTLVFTPYVGAGVAGTFATEGGGDTIWGANLLGGVSFKIIGTGLNPFIQARYTVEKGTDPLAVMGGLLFRFGGPL
ncbi:MAG TPA: hypothetical protein VFG50_03640 [Rhodothermales bacterium]|nr:hypothetical protein [Rhodothermales bacterium]